MAALNIFKKKPKERKGNVKEKAVKEEKEGITASGLQILRFPHITEKATDLAKNNQYVFKVEAGANKIEIRKAIKNIYGVKVLSVKIINVPRKRRRLGKVMGWRKGYKKAVVALQKGQKIEIMPR